MFGLAKLRKHALGLVHLEAVAKEDAKRKGRGN